MAQAAVVSSTFIYFCAQAGSSVYAGCGSGDPASATFLRVLWPQHVMTVMGVNDFGRPFPLEFHNVWELGVWRRPSIRLSVGDGSGNGPSDCLTVVALAPA